MPAVVHVGHDAFDVERQRPAVGVAQHQTIHTGRSRTFEYSQGELRIVAIAIEEMLGVVEHAPPRGLQEGHRLGHHGHTLIEGGSKRFGDVVVPRLAHDAHRGRAGVDQVPQRRVVVDLALDTPSGTERDERRRLQM